MKLLLYPILLFALISCKDQSPTNVFTPAAAVNDNSFVIQNPISQDTILYFNNFKSSYVDSRNLEIWLPQGYPMTDVDYQVLYMHDGQNVFNKSSASYGEAWEIDEKMDSLTTVGAIKPTIVVTTWCHPKKRFNEYMPQQPAELTESAIAKAELKKQTGYDQLYSDEYLKFVTSEVLPFVRKNFNVSQEPKDNVIMGSSMGGLISLYGMMEYPRVFGNAGCLSTHWPVPLLGDAFIESLPESIPDSKFHRIYFDYGTETLDKNYEPYQKRVDSMFLKKGYTSENYRSLKFEGHEHSEKYWRQRVAPALVFLLN
ncbi:MAG: alpha/beta hydrolase [Nonlabens sp.]|uniref:alpha/beta hydrolase n=1 Tax=Nonlabens sp. TaxID=1888209 RepID=UPI003EF26CE7